MNLDVYLHGKRVGGLFRLGEDHYNFAYAPETVAEIGAGAVLLSNSLPVRAEPYGVETTRAYVEGLLPQGARRRAIARELGLDASDGYGLIAELGGDCLGAVTFGHGPAEAEAATDSLAWLTDAELEELLQPRPERLFDESDPWRMRFALPGRRHKLALVYDEQRGPLGLAAAGRAQHAHRQARTAGAARHRRQRARLQPRLPGTRLPGRPHRRSRRSPARPAWSASASTAGARVGTWSACTRRASPRRSASPPTAPRGGSAPAMPSLGEASGLLRAIGEADAIETLMRVTFCDLLIGCTELRGGNAGLLLGPQGSLLAPFYGIVSTEVYGEVRPRPIVVGAPPAPLLVDLRYTIEFCGLEFQPALIDSVKLMAPDLRRAQQPPPSWRRRRAGTGRRSRTHCSSRCAGSRASATNRFYLRPRD